MHVDKDGRITGLLDYYLDLFNTLSKAPPNELEEECRVWFEQFGPYTWENEDDFIADFPELGMNFGLLAGDAVREGQCSVFVSAAFDEIAKGMLSDLRLLRSMGYFGGPSTGLDNGIA